MTHQRLWNPTLTASRTIPTTFVPESYTEKVTCPFCQRAMTGHYFYNDVCYPKNACDHFQGFVLGGETVVAGRFSGPANLVDEEE